MCELVLRENLERYNKGSVETKSITFHTEKVDFIEEMVCFLMQILVSCEHM
jgi:hypothetical protein